MFKLGTRFIKSAKQARAYARGEVSEGFVARVPEDVNVKALRRRLGYSQSEFSRRFGFAIDAVQEWEQHRRTPDPTARILLASLLSLPAGREDEGKQPVSGSVKEREPVAVSRALAR